MNLLEDIYYKKEYVSLYLNEDESVFEFTYKEGENYFYNISIKKPIKKIGGVLISEEFYDLETAYGYGGYLCNTNSEGFINKAINAYKEKCIAENIIAEFIRYHPFNTSHKIFNSYFDFHHNDRKTIYINLQKNKEERWSDYSSKTRNILRKCERELRIEESKDIYLFIELYKKTMNRNKADDFYYFEEEYFKNLLKLEDVRLFNVYNNDTLVSTSFILLSEDFGHYHLSANNYDLRKFNSNYFILDQIFDICRNMNIKYFNLGGGRSSDENDTLLKFKKKFSPLENDFYIAGKIYNKEVYDRFNTLWEKENYNNPIKYFLKYRL